MIFEIYSELDWDIFNTQPEFDCSFKINNWLKNFIGLTLSGEKCIVGLKLNVVFKLNGLNLEMHVLAWA